MSPPASHQGEAPGTRRLSDRFRTRVVWTMRLSSASASFGSGGSLRRTSPVALVCDQRRSRNSCRRSPPSGAPQVIPPMYSTAGSAPAGAAVSPSLVIRTGAIPALTRAQAVLSRRSSLVARRQRHRNVAVVCVFLVDVYCLGVGNAIGPDRMNERALRKSRSLDREERNHVRVQWQTHLHRGSIRRPEPSCAREDARLDMTDSTTRPAFMPANCE